MAKDTAGFMANSNRRQIYDNNHVTKFIKFCREKFTNRSRGAILSVTGFVATVFALWWGFYAYYKPAPVTTKKIVFIFDTGEGGGAGLPGYDLKTGIEEARDTVYANRAIDGISIDIRNDRGNVTEAKRLAEEASNDLDTLVVVGHLSSSITLQTIDIYSKKDVPLIMPVPTNPALTSKDRLNVLRLPPTDVEQAEVVAKFILGLDSVKRIAVIRDQDNASYSDFLAGKIISDLRQASIDKPNGPVVVDEELVGGGRVSTSVTDSLKAFNVDALVVAGTTDNAITLLEMLNAAQLNPIVIMTDGVIDKAFLHKISRIPNNLYVTFPLGRPKRPNESACSSVFAEFELSWCPYGFDAVVAIKTMLSGLVNNTNEKPSDLKKDQIVAYFQKLKHNDGFLTGEFNNYTFDREGDPSASSVSFSVWQADSKSRKFTLISPRN